MRRRTATVFLVAALGMALCAFKCNSSEPPEQQARDVISSSSGVLNKAQSEYLAQCKADPSQRMCVLINQAGSAQNASITALETYCGYQLSPVLPDPSATCTPVSSAAGALASTVTNLNQLMGEINAALNGTAPPPAPSSLPTPAATPTPAPSPSPASTPQEEKGASWYS